MDKHALGQQIPDIVLLMNNFILQNIPDMDQTDNIVDRIFVNRDAGNPAFLGKGKDLLPAVLDIERDHIDTGSNNLLHLNFIKLQSRLDKITFSFFQHPFFLDGFHNIFQFFFCNRWFSIL